MPALSAGRLTDFISQAGPMILYGGVCSECRSEPPLGRNDPCPCDSGRKFKKCHGDPANVKTFGDRPA
jgi:hypothetical protein